MTSIAATKKSTTVLFGGAFTFFIVFCVACYAWRAKADLTKKPMMITVLMATLLCASSLWNPLQKPNR